MACQTVFESFGCGRVCRSCCHTLELHGWDSGKKGMAWNLITTPSTILPTATTYKTYILIFQNNWCNTTEFSLGGLEFHPYTQPRLHVFARRTAGMANTSIRTLYFPLVSSNWSHLESSPCRTLEPLPIVLFPLCRQNRLHGLR